MGWDWNAAGQGAAQGAPGGVVGALAGGLYGGLTGGNPWTDAYSGFKKAAGLEATPYEYDPNAFVDPYREGNKEMLGQYLEQYGNRGVDQSAQQQFRNQQQSLIEALTRQANGEGPSLAQMQLRNATDRNMAQAMAMQASAGGDPALAMRNVANERAGIGQQMAGQSAMARLEEQNRAQSMLGQALAGARGQDIQASGLDVQMQALNDQMVRQFVMAGLSLDEAQFAANMELEKLKGQQHLGTQAINVGANQALIGGLLGGVGTAAEVMASGG